MRYGRRIIHLQNLQTKFQELINIPKKNKNNTLDINISYISNNKIVLLIHYVYKYSGFYFLNLPPEINDYIDQFLYENLYLEFSIFIPDEYPFDPPIWILSKLDISESKYDSFLSYYLFKLKYHNKQLKISWSSAIQFDKDILYFLSTINNFKDMFEF